MSTYTKFLEKPNSAKQTLVEIDIHEEPIFINYEPGIWFMTYSVDEKNTTYNFGTGAFGYGNFGSAGVADLTNDKPRVKIGSVWVDGEHYLRTTNLTDLRANNKSFYFKPEVNQILIHFDNFNPPECFSFIRIGVTHGYALQAAYYDDIYYDARIISIPNIVKRKDPLFYGLIRFEGGSIQLINVDGEFDNFANLNAFGQPVRILFGGVSFDYADFETVFAGTIEDFTFADGKITINVQDKRKALSRKIPINHFDAAIYPDMKTRNAGKPIPLGYGVIKNAPVLCTNEEGSAPFTFKIIDTTNYAIKAIDQVYVEDAEVNHGDEDLTNATFSLSAGVYTARDKVSVDFQGYESGGELIDNGLDIIADIMALFADTAYNAVNYDTTEWASEQAKVKDMCLFIEKETSIINVIEDICKSIPGSMIAQDDGLWTFKTYDADKTPDREIELLELLDPPRVGYESDEYLNSISVGYNKDWKNDEYQIEIDDSEEDAIFELYKERRSRTFETLLVSKADAETFASTILNSAGEIKPIFTIKTKTQNIDIELEDVVDVEVYQFSIGNYGSVRCEVIGIEKNLTEYIVTLTLRHIEDLEDFDLATLIKWRADGEYAAGDVVTYQGSLWRALDSSIAEIPNIASEYWTKYVSSAFHGLSAMTILADDDEVEVYDASEEVYQKIVVSNMPAAACIKKDGSTAFAGTGVGFKDEDDLSSDSAVAAASQQSIKAYVDALSSPGSEMFWPTETPPVGWLEEDGSAISRTTYAALFAVIGTMYGVGDGSTTFNLPDARGQFIRGWDHGAGVDPDAASRTDRGDGTTGDHVGTKQADELKRHRHKMNRGKNSGASTYMGTHTRDLNYWYANWSEYIGGNETRGKNTNRMLCIKY